MEIEQSNAPRDGLLPFPACPRGPLVSDERKTKPLPSPNGLVEASIPILVLVQDMEQDLQLLQVQSSRLLEDFMRVEMEAQQTIRMIESRRRTVEAQRQAHRKVKKAGLGPLLDFLCPGQEHFSGYLEALSDLKTTFYKRRTIQYFPLRLRFAVKFTSSGNSEDTLKFEVRLFKSAFPHERVVLTRRSKTYVEAALLWGNTASVGPGQNELLFDKLSFTDGTTAYPFGCLDLAVICVNVASFRPFVLHNVKVKSRRKRNALM